MLRTLGGLSGLSGTQRYALLVLVVVVIVVIYLIASGSFSDDFSGDDPQQSASGQTQSEQLGPAAIVLGETAMVGSVQATILELDFPDRIRAEGVWREPAERFARVLLTLTNVTNQAVPLPLDGLQLITTDGRAYLADAALSFGAARSENDAVLYAPPLVLQPQLAIDVVAVFDIPLNASGLQLRIFGGWTDFALFE